MAETQKISNYNWKSQNKAFRDEEYPNGVTKVLTEMKPPEKYSGVRIEPLVIYWMPVSNTDDLKPFFTISVSDFANPGLKTSFQNINMFSVSLYLREIRKDMEYKNIHLDMPNVEKRLEIMKSIVQPD